LGLQLKQQNNQSDANLIIEVIASEVTGLEGLPLTDLEQAHQERTWQIAGQAGYVKLQFVPGKGLAIIESTCPDQICVNTGFINKAGQSTVCVPNQVMLALAHQKQPLGEGEVDVILR
jgi:hypothetical protein